MSEPPVPSQLSSHSQNKTPVRDRRRRRLGLRLGRVSGEGLPGRSLAKNPWRFGQDRLPRWSPQSLPHARRWLLRLQMPVLGVPYKGAAHRRLPRVLVTRSHRSATGHVTRSAPVAELTAMLEAGTEMYARDVRNGMTKPHERAHRSEHRAVVTNGTEMSTIPRGMDGGCSAMAVGGG